MSTSTDSFDSLDGVSANCVPLRSLGHHPLTLSKDSDQSSCISIDVDCSDDPFNFTDTPFRVPLQDTTALRRGPAPELWSRAALGIYAQYAAVGFVFGTLPGTIYPLMQNYLNVDNELLMSAHAFVALPWSFKVFFGILSDCFPIRKCRRRPYMMIGWMICLAMLLVMAVLPLGEPYVDDPALRYIDPDEYTEAQMDVMNEDAKQKGFKYTIIMMVASAGYVIADVAADGAVVELAQREPESTRGSFQTVVFVVRTIFVVFSNLVVAFLFNGYDYGGHYAFSLSFPVLMLMLAMFCAPIIPTTWWFVRENKCTAPGFKTYMVDFWYALQTRAIYQVVGYKFFSGVFESFTYTAQDPVQTYWAEVTPQKERLSRMFSNMVMALGLVFVGRFGRNWNWRYVQAITLILVVALDAVCSMLTTWNIVRNPWFWLGVPVVEQFPSAVGFMVANYVVVELADEGNEAAICGLLTTVSNLAEPLSKTLASVVNTEFFDISNEKIQSDSNETRAAVSKTILIMYGMKLASLCFLVFLPSQRAACQQLKSTGGRSRCIGALTVAYVGVAFGFSVVLNTLQMTLRSEGVD